MSNNIKPIIFDLNDVRKKAENGDKFACYILGRSYDSEDILKLLKEKII